MSVENGAGSRPLQSTSFATLMAMGLVIALVDEPAESAGETVPLGVIASSLLVHHFERTMSTACLIRRVRVSGFFACSIASTCSR